MMNPPIEFLDEGGYTLAVANHGEIRGFTRRGVADLLSLLDDDPDFLQGSSVADKIVGHAAASLMIVGRVASLHTHVISRHALEILRDSDMEVRYDAVTDYVVNRRGDGMCPLERLCSGLPTPEICEQEIRKFLKNNANN